MGNDHHDWRSIQAEGSYGMNLWLDNQGGGGELRHQQGYFMGRFAISRHRNGINLAFVDGHARRSLVKGLWTQNWHQSSQPNYAINLP